jgi:hypothetical protein
MAGPGSGFGFINWAAQKMLTDAGFFMSCVGPFCLLFIWSQKSPENTLNAVVQSLGGAKQKGPTFPGHRNGLGVLMGTNSAALQQPLKTHQRAGPLQC